MVKPEAPTTQIAGYDADSVKVRGKDLVHDIMGNFGFVEYALFQALGQHPTPTQIRLVEAVMVCIMEHGLIPSAVASRLTYSGAPESFQGAVVAGLLGVGDRYAGTSSACGKLLEEIVAAADASACADQIVKDHRERRDPLPGFGHPVHKGLDPRVNKLLEIARSEPIDGHFLAALETLQQSLNRVVSKPLVTNISAAIPAVLAEAGIPSNLMRGIILIARCAGLVGHVFEEQANPIGDDLWHAASDSVTYDETP